MPIFWLRQYRGSPLNFSVILPWTRGEYLKACWQGTTFEVDFICFQGWFFGGFQGWFFCSRGCFFFFQGWCLWGFQGWFFGFRGCFFFFLGWFSGFSMLISWFSRLILAFKVNLVFSRLFVIALGFENWYFIFEVFMFSRLICFRVWLLLVFEVEALMNHLRFCNVTDQGGSKM